MGLVGVLLTTGAFAQGNFLQAKIPFEFVVGGNTHPAGNYGFSVSQKFVEMKSQESGKTVPLGYLTRIAADRTAAGTARISFDVQQGQHFIEAIWPDSGDGYLISTVKGEHSHEVVRMKMKK